MHRQLMDSLERFQIKPRSHPIYNLRRDLTSTSQVLITFYAIPSCGMSFNGIIIGLISHLCI
jgi:hypothetical protein